MSPEYEPRHLREANAVAHDAWEDAPPTPAQFLADIRRIAAEPVAPTAQATLLFAAAGLPLPPLDVLVAPNAGPIGLALWHRRARQVRQGYTQMLTLRLMNARLVGGTGRTQGMHGPSFYDGALHGQQIRTPHALTLDVVLWVPAKTPMLALLTWVQPIVRDFLLLDQTHIDCAPLRVNWLGPRDGAPRIDISMFSDLTKHAGTPATEAS